MGGNRIVAANTPIERNKFYFMTFFKKHSCQVDKVKEDRYTITFPEGTTRTRLMMILDDRYQIVLPDGATCLEIHVRVLQWQPLLCIPLPAPEYQ